MMDSCWYWYLQSAWRTRAWELDRARGQMPPPAEWCWLGGRSFLRSSFTKLSPMSVSGSDLISLRKDFLLSCVFSPWFWVCFLLLLFVCLFVWGLCFCFSFVYLWSIMMKDRLDLWEMGLAQVSKAGFSWYYWKDLSKKTGSSSAAAQGSLVQISHIRDPALHFNSPETVKSKGCCPVCRWPQ